jgi:SAM-dependent methyltransferase
MGYASAALDAIPEGADMGLGCGNPQAIAALKPGETVLDLGCGGGVDCFLAAQAVGESGQVIGVDMTPEMVRRARMNARQGAYDNVAFRLGEIEHLPVADASVDVIISNCVINLSPDKPQVLREAYRVLRPGGRLAFSDIVATAEMPQAIKEDVASYTGCVAGAASLAEWETILADSGFTGVEITCDEESRSMIAEWFPGSGAEEYVVSASIVATK